MRYRLRTLMIVLAGWLLVCGAAALVSKDFGIGFRGGLFDGMNSDFSRLKNVLGSPLSKWIFVFASAYLVAFVPLMWLNARGVISTKIFVRLYLPIWITIGIVGLSLDRLRGKDQPKD